MPELPEVECVRQGIQETCLGHKIVKVWSGELVHLLDSDSLPLRSLVGEKLLSIDRKGKYLKWNLTRKTVLVHLGMTGIWRQNYPVEKHTRIRVWFDDGRELSYTDARQFGYVNVQSQQTDFSRWLRLGPDALSRQWNARYALTRAQGCRVAIKIWLLDQEKVAGMGNIYVCETLFAARVHPEKQAGSLTLEDWKKIVQNSRRIMRRSIAQKGTTFSDYRLTNGKKGQFQSFLQIFQKAGQPCPSCGSPIQKIVQSGRSSFFCPLCQIAN